MSSNRVLLVEDGEVFGAMLSARLRETTDLEPVWVKSLAEATEQLEVQNANFAAAVLDLVLPDAPAGEVVDLVLGCQIPSIVATASIGEEVQDFVWSKRVVDYVLKEGPHSIDFLVGMLERLRRNRSTYVLIVDDSALSRKHIRRLLEVHQFMIAEAAGAHEALRTLAVRPGIKLVLTDYNMPDIDGFELVKRIRLRHPLDRLGIIGISSQDNPRIAARFMKYGANDFLTKPFTSEQLYCRVNQNIALVERFEEIRALSYIDPLTKLSNRRHFFDAGNKAFAKARLAGQQSVLAMADIDLFKRVNDTYGHDAGDAVIRNVARILRETCPDGAHVARLGGEEFCILVPDAEPELTCCLFEQIREKVEGAAVEAGDGHVTVTLSIGVCSDVLPSLEDMVREADRHLYEAKAAGRNRVVCSTGAIAGHGL